MAKIGSRLLNWLYSRSPARAEQDAQLLDAQKRLKKAQNELKRLKDERKKEQEQREQEQREQEQQRPAEPLLTLKKDTNKEPGQADDRRPDVGRKGRGFLGQNTRNRRRAMWKPDHHEQPYKKHSRNNDHQPAAADADHQSAALDAMRDDLQGPEPAPAQSGPCADCDRKNETIASLKEDKDNRGRQIHDLEERLRQEKKRKGGESGNGNGKYELGPEDFKPGTTLEALNLIEMLFPDNVHVLPSAKSSADRNRNFPRPNHAFDLMLRLATSYHNIVITRKSGKQQVREANLFGQNEYSEDESDTVKGNDKLANMRRFKDGEGGILEMMEHLKIGKGGKGDTWRCHFCVHKGKIYIGYCGAHLPVSGTS